MTRLAGEARSRRATTCLRSSCAGGSSAPCAARADCNRSARRGRPTLQSLAWVAHPAEGSVAIRKYGAGTSGNCALANSTTRVWPMNISVDPARSIPSTSKFVQCPMESIQIGPQLVCPFVIDRDGRWAARLGAFLVHLVTIDTGTEQREDAAPLSW